MIPAASLSRLNGVSRLSSLSSPSLPVEDCP